MPTHSNMTKEMLHRFSILPPGEQYTTLKTIAQSLHRAHNKYVKSCNKLKDYDGPYSKNARGATLYATMEKNAKLVRDLREQLIELVGVM